MTAEDFFSKKPEPTMLDENPKSVDDYDIEMLTQFCYDAGVEDDEIDETVQSLLDWRSKRAGVYHQAKLKEITDYDIPKIVEMGEGFRSFDKQRERIVGAMKLLDHLKTQ